VTPPSNPCAHHTRTEDNVRSPEVQLNGGSGLTATRHYYYYNCCCLCTSYAFLKRNGRSIKIERAVIHGHVQSCMFYKLGSCVQKFNL
jgi:hypothetical protein